MVACQDDLFGREEWDPALGFQGLAGFVDNHYIELLVPKLKASGSMQSSQNDLATSDQCGHTLLLSLTVLFPQVFHVCVNGSSLSTIASLLNAGLFSVHFLSHVFDYAGCF